MIGYFDDLCETRRYIARHRLTRKQIVGQLRIDMYNALMAGCCGDEEREMRLLQIAQVLDGDPNAFRLG
jgi:hypothetical protein